MVSTDLIDHVKAGFVAQKTTLSKWCASHPTLSRQSAYKALTGAWRGPKAELAVQILIDAAGVKPIKKARKPHAKLQTRSLKSRPQCAEAAAEE